MTELATGSATSGEAARTALYTRSSGGSGGGGEASESGEFICVEEILDVRQPGYTLPVLLLLRRTFL